MTGEQITILVVNLAALAALVGIWASQRRTAYTSLQPTGKSNSRSADSTEESGALRMEASRR